MDYDDDVLPSFPTLPDHGSTQPNVALVLQIPKTVANFEPAPTKFWCDQHGRYEAAIQFLRWYRPHPSRPVYDQITDFFRKMLNRTPGYAKLTLQQFTHMIAHIVVSVVFYNLGDNPLPPAQCFYEADHGNGLWEPMVAVSIDNHEIATQIHAGVRRIMNEHYSTLSAEQRESECHRYNTAFVPAQSGEPDAEFDVDSFFNSLDLI